MRIHPALPKNRKSGENLEKPGKRGGYNLGKLKKRVRLVTPSGVGRIAWAGGRANGGKFGSV